jgi:HlyD family secretion protein
LRPGFGVAIFVAGTSAGLVVLIAAGPEPSQANRTADVASVRPNASSGDGSEIHALARLEPASGLITVGARPGARIIELSVKEGDQVKAGALLATLEGHDEAQSRLALAQAQKASGERSRALQREKLVLEREAYDRLKDDRLQAAEKANKLNSAKLQELKLVDSKLVDALGKDARAKLDVGQVRFQLEQASLKSELDLQELKADQAMQKRRRALEDKNVDESSPTAEVLNIQYDLARAAVAQTEVRAPSAGKILEILAHPGEVSAGQILLLGDVSSMVARAEVYQTDIPAVKVGTQADVRVFDQVLSGTVTKVGHIVGRNELRNVDPRALQDMRVVKVSVTLDDASTVADLVNMQVEVTIRPRKGTR